MYFSSLRICGNGPGVAGGAATNQLTVTFNPPAERPFSVRDEIQISNWKHAGLQTDCRPFVVAAPCLGPVWCKQLEDLLRRLAITLEPILGCVPSSGLVTVHAALQLAERVSVYRMPLNRARCARSGPTRTPRTDGARRRASSRRPKCGEAPRWLDRPIRGRRRSPPAPPLPDRR